MTYSSVREDGSSSIYAVSYNIPGLLNVTVHMLMWFDPVTLEHLGTFKASSKQELFCAIKSLMVYQDHRCDLHGLQILTRELLAELPNEQGV